MKNNEVYLTFKTDKETCYHLTNIAHMIGKTQPDLINDLCQNFVKAVLTKAEDPKTKEE